MYKFKFFLASGLVFMAVLLGSSKVEAQTCSGTGSYTYNTYSCSTNPLGDPQCVLNQRSNSAACAFTGGCGCAAFCNAVSPNQSCSEDIVNGVCDINSDPTMVTVPCNPSAPTSTPRPGNPIPTLPGPTPVPTIPTSQSCSGWCTNASEGSCPAGNVPAAGSCDNGGQCCRASGGGGCTACWCGQSPPEITGVDCDWSNSSIRVYFNSRNCSAVTYGVDLRSPDDSTVLYHVRAQDRGNGAGEMSVAIPNVDMMGSYRLEISTESAGAWVGATRYNNPLFGFVPFELFSCGSLMGRVTDSAGNGAGGVNVTVSSGRGSRQVTTRSDGYYYTPYGAFIPNYERRFNYDDNGRQCSREYYRFAARDQRYSVTVSQPGSTPVGGYVNQLMDIGNGSTSTGSGGNCARPPLWFDNGGTISGVSLSSQIYCINDPCSTGAKYCGGDTNAAGANPGQYGCGSDGGCGMAWFMDSPTHTRMGEDILARPMQIYPGCNFTANTQSCTASITGPDTVTRGAAAVGYTLTVVPTGGPVAVVNGTSGGTGVTFTQTSNPTLPSTTTVNKTYSLAVDFTSGSIVTINAVGTMASGGSCLASKIVNVENPETNYWMSGGGGNVAVLRPGGLGTNFPNPLPPPYLTSVNPATPLVGLPGMAFGDRQGSLWAGSLNSTNVNWKRWLIDFNDNGWTATLNRRENSFIALKDRAFARVASAVNLPAGSRTGAQILSMIQSAGASNRIDGAAANAAVVWVDGDLTVTSALNLGNNKAVIIVDGDVTLEGEVHFNYNAGFLTIISSGDITVGNNVGYLAETPEVNLTAEAPNIEGIYYAGGTFKTGTDLNSSDRKLRIDGTVIGMTGVDLSSRSALVGQFPTHYFKFRPELVVQLNNIGLRQKVFEELIGP